MVTLTKKEIEDIVEDKINVKVEYAGRMVNEDLIRLRPSAFGFWKINDNGEFYGLAIVKEKDISLLLKEKVRKEEEEKLKQNKLI